MASRKGAFCRCTTVPPNLPKKKQKTDKLSLKDLKTIGEKLLTSRLHVNNLPILLEFISPKSSPQFAIESLLSLKSFFTPLLPQLTSSSLSKYAKSDSEPEMVYRKWIRSKFDEFVQCLIGLAVSLESEDTLRELVLNSIMKFVKLGNAGKFHSAVYHKLLCSIIDSMLGVDDFLLDLLSTKYFTYIDVCYFTYISLEKLARTLEGKEVRTLDQDSVGEIQSNPSKELSIVKMNYLLCHMPPLETSEENLKMWSAFGMLAGKSDKIEHTNSKESNPEVVSLRILTKKMKLKFSQAWISFLRLRLPLGMYKEVLATLHQDVIPHLSNPIMLCDFLTQSYDIGGVVSITALSSLYILMTQHGLEYPNFYDKLYALLEPSIFIAKHRTKFFELLDLCLKSSLLPAYLAAAFCKRLSKLALFVPPSGALVIIALVHNLLQRHPSIYFLVHQEYGNGVTSETSIEESSFESLNDCDANNDLSEKKTGIDQFRNEENDPRKANAMRSSLWEIDTIRHHYYPPVSRFVLSLENDLASKSRSAEIAVKDFSSASYATFFNDEIRRRVKQVPLAFYNSTPTMLFSESNFPGWAFKISNEVSTAMRTAVEGCICTNVADLNRRGQLRPVLKQQLGICRNFTSNNYFESSGCYPLLGKSRTGRSKEVDRYYFFRKLRKLID